ncbi:MAG TPA: hypothetical protein VIA62_24330 [Thermoanaerobaculia bacterium]|jgi:hypothetical protein|nr:hypothetical protein [Thermoanaerobaculia bacterium]
MTEPRSPRSPTPPPGPEPPVRWSWGARFWFLVTLLIGPAYVLWMTGVEGRRIWVVVGILLLIALCAGLAHRLMGMTRR